MPRYFCHSLVKALALPRRAVASASRIPAGRTRRAWGRDLQDAAQPCGSFPRALVPVRGGWRDCRSPVASGHLCAAGGAFPPARARAPLTLLQFGCEQKKMVLRRGGEVILTQSNRIRRNTRFPWFLFVLHFFFPRLLKPSEQMPRSPHVRSGRASGAEGPRPPPIRATRSWRVTKRLYLKYFAALYRA